METFNQPEPKVESVALAQIAFLASGQLMEWADGQTTFYNFKTGREQPVETIESDLL